MFKTVMTALAAVFAVTGAAAAPLADAANDFLATYAGPTNGDLDILSVEARFDGTAFTLGSVQNGAVGTVGSLFVWGINRGAGTARLSFGSPSVGAAILFDAVAVFFADGTGRVVTFPAIGAPTITALSGVTIAGNSIGGVIPLSLLPSRGFAATDYTFNLWSRQRANPALDGGNVEIADFAPDGSSFAATVPEPASWALMIGGFGVAGARLRHRRTHLA